MTVSIIISALLFSAAYFYTMKFGWLILLFWVPIFLQQYWFKSKRIFRSFFVGFMWGAVAFGLHFWWLFDLLHTKSNATTIFSFFLYVVVVICFSLTSAGWFFVSNLLLRLFTFFRSILISLVMFLITMSLYFCFIHYYGLWFLGKSEGYPMLLPLLPLSRYGWFLKLFLALNIFFQGKLPTWDLMQKKFFVQKIPVKANTFSGTQVASFPMPILYLPPDTKEKFLYSPQIAGQRIYQKLALLNLQSFTEKVGEVAVTMPEASFPFALNENKEVLSLWSSVLPPRANFFIGAYRAEQDTGVNSGKKKKRFYQSIFWICGGQIIDFYDKSHTVYFTEKIPKFLKKNPWAKNLFLRNRYPINKPKKLSEQKVFSLPGSLKVIPQICSEFLCNANPYASLATMCKAKNQKHCMVWWFAKDSWFCKYFQNLLENFVFLRSAQFSMPVLYITYSKVLSVSPS